MSILATNIKSVSERNAAEKAEADRLHQEQIARSKAAEQNYRLTKAQRAEALRQRAERARIEAERKRVKRVALDFTHRFGKALCQKTERWSSVKDLELADAYATALLDQSADISLPDTPEHVMRVVNDTFAYGVMLAGSDLPPNVFAGQKQDWFPTLLEQVFNGTTSGAAKSTPVPSVVSQDNIRISKPIVTIPSDEVQATVSQLPTNRERQAKQLPAAITPRSKSRKGRRASKSGKAS